MQIRFANRQDEAPLRALLESQGANLDMSGKDEDLRNLDLNYFGHDGLFIVAEVYGKVEAFAGARQAKDDASTLEILRLNVSNLDSAQVKERFLAIIKNHAYQMDYKKIILKV